MSDDEPLPIHDEEYVAVKFPIGRPQLVQLLVDLGVLTVDPSVRRLDQALGNYLRGGQAIALQNICMVLNRQNNRTMKAVKAGVIRGAWLLFNNHQFDGSTLISVREKRG